MYHSYEDVVVCYGYVYKDDFWAIKDDFIKCVRHCGRMMGNPNAQVAFPLYNIRKESIGEFLDELGLLEHTWYCEDPQDGKPCGVCGSCKRVKDFFFNRLEKSTTPKDNDELDPQEE